MKTKLRILIYGALLLAGLASTSFAQNVGGGDSTVNNLDQWKATSTPISAITQRVFGKPVVLTGYSSGCAQFTATGTLQSTGTNCGAGGGTSTPSIGSGGWVQFASTTSGYFDAIAGFIFNKSTGALSIDGTMSANIYIATSTTATSSLPNIVASSTFITANGLGTTQNLSRGFLLQNLTPATLGNQQISPSIRWRGNSWDTGGAGSSRSESFLAYLLPIQGGTGSPTSKWTLGATLSGSIFTDRFSVDNLGGVVSTVNSGSITGYEIAASMGNSTPGTTQHIKLSNVATNSWITGYFSGTLKNAIGFSSTGEVSLYSQNGNHNFYSNVSAPSLQVQIYSGGIYNVGGSFNGANLTAGQANTSPPSTFTNYGSTALQITKIDTTGTLTGQYTQILVDASGSVCTGTPSNACATHSDQTACELYNSHGGCTWNPGSDCSVYANESGMSTCGSTSGCSVTTTSCAGPGDQTACEAQDDSYGGACAWTEGFGDCSVFNADESTCGATSGCTQNFGDCSPYSDGGGDGSACTGYNAGCSYDSGSGTCSGTPFLSCSGTYSLGFGCTGSYNTGGCTGTYGSGCTGTPSCSGVGTGSCTSETGCSLTTGVNLTMPADSASLSRTYWIKKITSGTLTLTANTGQTFHDTGGSTYSTATSGTAVMLSYYRDLADCSTFVSAGTCTPSGCTINNGTCSWDSGMSTCSGNAVCVGLGDQMTCEATTYFNSCSGTYVVSKKWYIMSSYKQQ